MPGRDSLPYSDWSDARSDAYSWWSDARGEVYGNWSDTRSDLYGFYTDVRSELYSGDIEGASDELQDFKEILPKCSNKKACHAKGDCNIGPGCNRVFSVMNRTSARHNENIANGPSARRSGRTMIALA